MQQDIVTLNLFGATFLDVFPFMYECLFLILILGTSIFYASVYLFNTVEPFNFGLIRTIVDSQREQKAINELMLTVAREFEISSRNYVRTCIYGNQDEEIGQSDFNRIRLSSKEVEKKDDDYQERRSNFRSNEENERFDKLLVRQPNRIVRDLKQLLLSGQLQPKNRVTKLVKPLAILFGPLFCFLVVWCLLVVIALINIQRLSRLFNQKSRNSLMDEFAVSQYFLCGFYGTFMICFYSALLISASLDQSPLVRKLIKMMKECPAESFNYWTKLVKSGI